MPDQLAGTGPSVARRTSFRVFVSSTFQDFHHERDALRRVESALRERLRPSGVGLTLVDLRWGVFSEGSEGERELDILGVCLDEVERTRPLFLGLLGDRYGWVPDPELATAVAADRGFPGAVAGRSVTELEIEHGVLGHPEILEHSVFLFRDFEPGPPPDMAEAAGSAGRVALDCLRERIESSGARTVRYPVDADRYSEDLEAFEALAIDELWRLLEPQIVTDDDPVDTMQEGFRHDRSADYVDDGLLGRIAERITTGPATTTVLTGGVGAGKSAAVAELAGRLDRAGVRSFFHAFGLGPASTRRELVDRLVRRAGVDDVGGRQEDRRRAALASLDDGTPFVLCLDALDASPDDTDRALSWLPDPLPHWLHVVASTSEWPMYATRAATVEQLAPLDLARAAEITRRRFVARAKQIPQPALEALVTKPNGSVRASESPLWITLAADILAGLDVSDFARLDGLPGDAQERVVALVSSTAEALPGDLAGLYASMVERATRTEHPEVTHAVLRSVALSPAGLPPRELTAVASELAGRPITDRDVARVRWSLRGQLIETGISGEIDIAHHPLHDAVAGPLTDDALSRIRSRMAETLFRLRDQSAVADDTALWLYFSAGDADGVRAWVNSAEHDEALVPALVEHWTEADSDADQSVVDAVVADATDLGARCLLIAGSELEDRGVAPRRRLEIVSTIEAAIRRRADRDRESTQWLHLLGMAMMRRRNLLADLDPRAAAALAERITGLYHHLVGLEDDATWQVNLAEALIEQARLLGESGDHAAAVPLAREAIAAAERAVDLDDQPTHRREVGDIGRLASRMLADAGERTEAEAVAGRALAELEALERDRPDDLDVLHGLNRARSHVAGLAQRTGDLERASDLLDRAALGAERVVAEAPSDSSALRAVADIRKRAAMVCGDLGRVVDEAAHLEAAERHHRTAARLDPGDLSALAGLVETLRQQADNRRSRADFDDARHRFAVCIDAARRLAEIDHSPARQELLASVLVSAADLEVGCDQLDRAAELVEAAEAAGAPVIAQVPEGAATHRMVADISALAGRLALEREDLSAARRHHEAAVTARERVVELDPGNASTLLKLAASLQELSEIAFLAGDLATAGRLLERALPLMSGLEQLDPDNPRIASGVAQVLAAAALVLHEEGDGPAALELLHAARSRWEQISSAEPTALDPYVRLAGVRVQIGLLAGDAGDRDVAIAELLAARRLFETVGGLQANEVTDRGIHEVDAHLAALGWSGST